MLNFTTIDPESAGLLEKYYRSCTYRLCEYSVGVKIMWREHWAPEYAESHGCLIVLNHSRRNGFFFDFPVPLPGQGDVEAALEEIEAWCLDHEVSPAFGDVPQEMVNVLTERYPYVSLESSRLWQDYLYDIGDLATFVGRKYSGQRNHINKFHRLFPDARYKALTPEDRPALELFWERYHDTANKSSPDARREICYAWRMMDHIGEDWVRAGAIVLGEEILAISLGEVCGETLICHIEKGLSGYDGVYPAMVQSFAAANREGVRFLNREDDAGEAGLRTSKLQYLPLSLESKHRVMAKNELHSLRAVPELRTERLTLTALRDEDQYDYNRLCTDDALNKWWGYDFRDDLHEDLTADYFLKVAREDLAAGQALNLAIRLEGRFIGEVVLYHFDCKGGAELGCRILREHGGCGYGAEAFRAMAMWSLYELGLYVLRGKCCKENEPSRRMLSACMRPAGEDEEYFYFEKRV